MNLPKTLTGILHLCAVALLAGPVSAQPKASREEGATVTIHVIDENGRTVPCRMNSFTGTYTKRELGNRFSGLQGTGIPYGTYDYILRREGSDAMVDGISGRVSVRSLEELLVVTTTRRYFIPGVAVDTAPPRGFVIRGRLDPMPAITPSLEPIWIRLLPIHKHEQFDIKVDPSGEFRIYQYLTGRYLLAVVRGEEVLHVEQISFEGSAGSGVLVVKLPDKPPATTYFR